MPHLRILFTIACTLCFSTIRSAGAEDVLSLQLRYQTPVAAQSDRYHTLDRAAKWNATATAIIVCDMWDSHHCYRAVQRSTEFAPRLNALLNDARRRGVTIIHAPSGCMDAYTNHPARKRAIDAPVANDYPAEIEKWCYTIPAEEKVKYPIDQSDGGEDDTPEEHAAWEAQLKKEGRVVRAPWLKQMDLLTIDAEQDFISDQGKEVWNILQSRGIDNVILTGVHTNMCVLGRPFGLRRMAQGGKQTVLLRDLTDTMYNPAAWPYVSHFSGTDLIIDHIERHVCATITSDQLIGGQAFRFASDRRPEIAVVINESEYETEKTLTKFVEENLRRDHRIRFVYGSDSDDDAFPAIDSIANADLLILSVRRRTPPEKQLDVIRNIISSGKPVIAIRTSSHAFQKRNQTPEVGYSQWPTFDADVIGGHYTNHYGNDLVATVTPTENQLDHPILKNLDTKPFSAGGSLYKVSPLDPKAVTLLVGAIDGHDPEPVAWTFIRNDQGRTFYTSLGAPKDFENPSFKTLLVNAAQWALNRQGSEQ